MFHKRYVLKGALFLEPKAMKLLKIEEVINDHGERSVTYSDRQGNKEAISYQKFLEMPIIPCIN